MSAKGAFSHDTPQTAPQLIEFIENKLDTLVKWDLLQFFYHKPNMLGTAPKIASMIGRDLRKVDLELREMAARGLLEAQEKGGVKVYRLATDKPTRRLIEQFVRACDDRRFREAAIYHAVTATPKR